MGGGEHLEMGGGEHLAMRGGEHLRMRGGEHLVIGFLPSAESGLGEEPDPEDVQALALSGFRDGGRADKGPEQTAKSASGPSDPGEQKKGASGKETAGDREDPFTLSSSARPYRWCLASWQRKSKEANSSTWQSYRRGGEKESSNRRGKSGAEAQPDRDTRLRELAPVL